MILSGRDIEWYIKTKKLVISPCFEDQFQQNGIDLRIKDVDLEKAWLGQGSFCLGVTNEYLELPDDLMAFVNLRSTWARKGFVIPPTIVDAGFKGTLTIEIVAASPNPIPLGERFLHLIFAKMTSHSEPYNGKYQGQIAVTPAIPDK